MQVVTTYAASLRARPGARAHRGPVWRGEGRRVDERRGEQGRGEERRLSSLERRARALGWFSLGLGLAEVLDADGFARGVVGAGKGVRQRGATFLVGVREIVSGIGLLATRSPFWLWARVAGDVMDLALLGRAGRARGRGKDRVKLAASAASVAGVLLLDAVTAMQLARAGRRGRRREGVHVCKSITVNRPPDEVYGIWRDLQNVPLFMARIESVLPGDDGSRWRAAAPGSLVGWDVEIVEDRAGEIIAWRSLEGSKLEASGSVCFEPTRGGRATAITVELRCAAARGRVGAALAKLFGQDPATELGRDLRRFKQLVETGEVVHSDASIHEGRHPARPPTPEELEALR